MLIEGRGWAEVACLDLGGWDTHIAQGGSAGPMATLLAKAGAGLAALYADLHDQANRLLVVTMWSWPARAERRAWAPTTATAA